MSDADDNVVHVAFGKAGEGVHRKPAERPPVMRLGMDVREVADVVAKMKRRLDRVTRGVPTLEPTEKDT